MKKILLGCIGYYVSVSAALVGGPCEYKEILGTATIVVKDNKTVMASFEPNTMDEKNELLKKGRLFYVEQPINGEKGSHYPAIIEMITKGTCVPWNFSIINSETTSQ